MTQSIGGEWHRQACGWFDSVISVEGLKLLDAGCGLGHFMKGFADLDAKVTGCDASKFCVDFVKEKLGFECYQTRLESMVQLPNECFHITFCTSVLEHIPKEHIQRTLLNLHRVTKRYGTIYLEADTMPNEERNMPEESHVNIRTWEEWLEVIGTTTKNWVPNWIATEKLKKGVGFPGFPCKEWNFLVLTRI